MAKIRVFTKRPVPLIDQNIVTILNHTVPFNVDIYQQIDNLPPTLVQKLTFTPATAPPPPPTNNPPIAKFMVPLEADVGQVISLDSSSSSDPDGNTMTFLWSVNGATLDQVATNPTNSFKFPDIDQVSITLTVTDVKGLAGSLTLLVNKKVVPPSPINLDKNGVERIALPTGLKYDNENYSPKENFRDDGSRLDFDDSIRNAACIGGYLKTSTTVTDEEFAGKLLGTHSNSGNNSGTYVIGIRVDGDRARLRKEIHNDYTDTLNQASQTLGSLRNKWVGFQFLKINRADKTVLLQAYVDNDPFDATGKPNNNWKKIYEIVDNGNLASGKFAPVWIEPSVKGKSQYTLRIDKNSDDKDVEYKNVFIREIVSTTLPPPPPPTCPPNMHWDDVLKKCVEDSVTPPPTGDKDEFGTQMLHKVTGKKVDMKVGGDPAGNGQRYSVNHTFQNYMMIGYFKTGDGQKQIEMKTDGPNHGGCKKLPECMWYEPQILTSGKVSLGGEWPHPENHSGLRMDFSKDVDDGLKNQWLGYAVIAYWNSQNQRVLEQWCAKNPFGADGKPTNNWIMNMKTTETGDGKMFPKQYANRPLPTKFDEGLEAEIRMHGESKGHGKPGGTDMKFCRVWELKSPAT